MAGNCVRVEPTSVNFRDVTEGQVYKTAITVTNVGKTLKKIVIEKPSSRYFKFTATSPAEIVAPGLSVIGLLQFTPEEEQEVKDCLLIHIDDAETIKVPLHGFPRACSLTMDPVLDFGCIAANSQIISKLHSITNEGTAPGLFQVQYSGDSSVKLSPCSGVIAPGATKWLKAELCTDRPCQLEDKALVKLQNCPAVTLSIRAEVVDQRLELFDLKGAPLTCLWFGPVFFGTSRVEKVVLRNNAPQACDWVCLFHDTVDGTEVGTDLQKSTDAALLDGMEKCRAPLQDAAQVLACCPKQGRLGPFDSTTVALRFTPVCKSTVQKTRDHSPKRQDYCLFLVFESVGSRHGFTHRTGDSSVELAVTGSGLPVSVKLSPSRRFDFPACVTGQRVEKLCALHNLCPQLPIKFHFRKQAHFTTEPSSGTVAPGKSQDIVLSFTARQSGSFQVRQLLDILGLVHYGSDNTDVTELELRSFYTISLHLSAVSTCDTEHSRAKLSAGLTPLLSSSAGTQPHISPSSRAINISPTSSHRQQRCSATDARCYYVDTDYALTEEEEEQKSRNRQIYADFVNELRRSRLLRIKERQRENAKHEVDIGIVPAQGLIPPKLCINEIENSDIQETKTNSSCSRDTMPITQLTNSQVSEVMNAVPSNSQEVADCSRTLTAEELHQVIIDPLSVDFGEVCVQSVCVQKLQLINHLSVCVWVQLEVDCSELQGSSPLSHVLPPLSHHTIPLTFQSNKRGPFYRPVSYSINQQHPGQILVQAQVVPLALELSTTLLVLRPTPSLLAQSGYRSSLTIRNQRNQAAEFTWRPIVSERGILFSVRPATGIVEPYKELDCEVVWHPSFSSPAEGDFDFSVHDGNTQRLHCVAKVGSTRVQLAEKQVSFGSVPLNMSSVRTAVLHNTGQNHAYYQVLDVCPLPGMVVRPCEGVVPSRGQAVLKIHFFPNSVIKFDTKVKIALRDMKSLELRVGGSVEPPNVDISVSCFQFGGVHAGSRRRLPFTLTNRSSATGWVTFDLSRYADFSVQLHQLSGQKEPGVNVVEVQGNRAVDCSLVFSPTHAATYDFDLPLTVNGMRSPASPFPSPTPSSSSTFSSLSAVSWKHMVKPLSRSVAMATQQLRRVQAIVLCAPLEMSPLSLHFHVQPLNSHSDAYTKTVQLKAACQENVCWHGVANDRVHWWFKSSLNSKDREGGEGGLCSLTPSSGSLGPGQSICLVVSIRPEAVRTVCGRSTRLTIPLYLGDEAEEGKGEEGLQPYRELLIIITQQVPRIIIHPPQILFTPVPLENAATATLTLLAVGYPSGTRIVAEVDEVELDDGIKLQPVCVTFPEGNFIPCHNHSQKHQTTTTDNHSLEANVTSLICSVSFCSPVPLSLRTTITFTDHFHNRFKVNVCALADSCLLTVWPYMALHRSEQQIVLKTGATAVEAILQRYQTPSPASVPASSSSSFDHHSSTNKSSTSGSFPDSDSVSGQASSDDDVSTNSRTLSNLGVPEFPPDNSDEGLYHETVLLAVERWFSLFGWPSGPHPISIPYTLRRIVSKVEMKNSTGRTYRVSQNTDCRSVVDMLHHLTGRQIRGISRCQTFSSDKHQRTNQLIQQHEAMLTFLREQGACLSHIRPEYLLDIQEFKHWSSLQSDKKEDGVNYSSVDYESLSKRAWTDVLLQIYKVLVLCRVSKLGPNTTPSHEDMEGISSQPLTSNVYSAWELQLLTWLNKHYQNKRKTVWATGNVPSARWIVNFDLDLADGLVLAAVLAAYCPYLICSHFRRMYTTTSSLEQILHNNIIVIQALTALSLNIDIHPTDLSDPNPVQMLMLCVHLYERLPQYLPVHTITMSGGLYSTFRQQVRLKNPSSKAVKYKAFILGEDAHLFSLPEGSAVIIPPNAISELAVNYSCYFLQPMQAVLLLISNCGSGLRGSALAFSLKTHVSHITPTNTVKCLSPCYQLRVIQLPITNPFNREAKFRVVLVESSSNPLEPEKKQDGLIQKASSKANTEKMTSDQSCGEDAKETHSSLNGEGGEFLSTTRSVSLKSGQVDTLKIHYLPFFPGVKYCSVLLVCPQVGDMVYMVKATAKLPLPSPLTARPSSNIISIPDSSADPEMCVSVLSLHCEIEQVCEASLRVPLINMSWERALAIWGQHSMSADEHRRRMLTGTLCSSTVRTAAVCKLFKQAQLMRADHSNVLKYSVDVSMPQYFTLPKTVEIPIKENTSLPWENPAGCGFVDIPLRFQADRVGQFTCQVVLKSWCDTRVYMLEALVTSQGGSVHLDFSSPVHRPVTKNIPLQNMTHQDWIIQAKVCGEVFSGPEVLNVPAGTRVSYPLSFCPSAQGIVMGKLSLHNDCDGAEHVFTLRGAGEHPLPVDHVVLHCRVGETIHTQLDVPNYSHNNLTLKVVTDLSIVSGPPSLEIEASHNAPYTLTVTPWKRGKQTGRVSFVETETEADKGCVRGCYEVYFSLELMCEPAAPIRVIDVQCVAQSSVAIEIPVNNPQAELLTFDVHLEGDDLIGADSVSVPPRHSITYKATFSPTRVGKSTGSVVFQSELEREIWYQLELYALPPAVTSLPQTCCLLGKWTRQTIPLVNPTADTLELTVSNTNPRNYTLEMDSGSTLVVEPHSSTELSVRFRPSSIGEGNHTAKLTFTCPQLQEWCVLLSGRGLNPESEERCSISAAIGSSASIAIPFTNPTELPATLSLILTDQDPSCSPDCRPLPTDEEVFSIPLSQTEGIKISQGASFDVPVVFAPKSMKQQEAWLCITMTTLSSKDINSNIRSEQESSAICWIYPLCGVPVEAPVENSPLGVLRCEASRQLEKRVDVLLSGCVPGSQGRKRREASQAAAAAEDFLCEVRSNTEAERAEMEGCLSASVESASRDPESGNVTLTLHLVYTPFRPCRQSAVLAVQSVSGRRWEFPVVLVATEPLVDDVIFTEATEFGKTSAVGFRLTSTSRELEPFTAEFLPGSSSEFTVSPTSGTLPPAGSSGLLITVLFTPTASNKRHIATLTIQATQKQWTYEVRGKTAHDSPPPSTASGSSFRGRRRNFVTHNLRLPSLANSSPVKLCR